MKFNTQKGCLAMIGVIATSFCFGNSLSTNLLIHHGRLQSGGIAPFVVTGTPGNSYTVDPVNTGNDVNMSMYSATNCGGSSICGPTITGGTLTLNVGQTYYFSSESINLLAILCPSSTQSVFVDWGDSHVTNLCMNITCAGGNCSYAGAPGTVAIS